MKKKYGPHEIMTSIPRYISNERREYLKNQEEIAKAEEKLKELKNKIKEMENKAVENDLKT
jgi:uncharacterized protein YydD (DUF2326 family)